MLRLLLILACLAGTAAAHHSYVPFEEWDDYRKKTMLEAYGSKNVAIFMAGNLSIVDSFDQNDFELIKKQAFESPRIQNRLRGFNALVEIIKNRPDLLSGNNYDETVEQMLTLLRTEDSENSDDHENYVEYYLIKLDGNYIPKIDALVRDWAENHRDLRIRGCCQDYLVSVEGEPEKARQRAERNAKRKRETRKATPNSRESEQLPASENSPLFPWWSMAGGIVIFGAGLWWVKRPR